MLLKDRSLHVGRKDGTITACCLGFEVAVEVMVVAVVTVEVVVIVVVVVGGLEGP